MGTADVLLANATVIAIAVLSLWVVSLVVRNASIVDIFWGFGFVLVAWTSFAIADGAFDRQVLLAVLTTIWGLRLTAYLAWRNLGKGEDYRYVAMRQRWGKRFPLVSLGTVFVLQGTLMWLVSLPIQVGQVPQSPDGLIWLDIIGIVFWGTGIFFESVGDIQLARFKRNPANVGRVMDQGLWRYTRHPNYFGDFMVWWGIYLIAAESGAGAWGFVGPVLMTILLVKVSGAGLLEKDIGQRRPGYAEYVRRTSGFLPRPPRP